MKPFYIDPAPRQYPASVKLIARSMAGPDSANGTTSFEDLENWLLGDAINEQSMLSLFESLAWRMVGAGLPLSRATIHAGTLHPQLAGFAWGWQLSDGICDEIVVKAMIEQDEAFRCSPLRPAIERGEIVILDTRNEEHRQTYPLMEELAEQGIIHYAVLPMPKRVRARRHDVVTLATNAEEGFTGAQRMQLSRILKCLSLHVHRHIAYRIAENLLNVYLGPSAGQQVLEGSIARGAGSSLDAVVWFADMRNYTRTSEKFAAADVSLLLNGFLDVLVTAVTNNGGDVLKFMGDGILAVFPFTDADSARTAARAAMQAADDALTSLDNFNINPPADVSAIAMREHLRCGIAMHQGEVFFGNVGGRARLDFTVIGRTVNEAARLEQLTKKLMRPVLMSQEVARHLDVALDDCGNQELPGFADPVKVFAPRHWKSSAMVV